MADLMVGCPEHPLKPINTVINSFSVHVYGYSKSVLFNSLPNLYLNLKTLIELVFLMFSGSLFQRLQAM